jgi:hypothetical protein
VDKFSKFEICLVVAYKNNTVDIKSVRFENSAEDDSKKINALEFRTVLSVPRPGKNSVNSIAFAKQYPHMVPWHHLNIFYDDLSVLRVQYSLEYLGDNDMNLIEYYRVKESCKKGIKVSSKTLKHIQTFSNMSVMLDGPGNIFLYYFSPNNALSLEKKIKMIECIEIVGKYDGATVISENRIAASRKGILDIYELYRNLTLDENNKVRKVLTSETHETEKVGYVAARSFKFNAHHDNINYMTYNGEFSEYR